MAVEPEYRNIADEVMRMDVVLPVERDVPLTANSAVLTLPFQVIPNYVCLVSVPIVLDICWEYRISFDFHFIDFF